MMRRVLLLFALGALIGGVATTVALSENGELSVSASGAQYEMPNYGLQELTDDFDFAVIGTVLHVGEPQWNSEDGQHWEDEALKNQFTSPTVFTPITIMVSETIWSSGESPDKELTVWFLGDPSTGESKALTQSDGFGEGDQRVFFVYEGPMPFQNGYTDPVNRSFSGMATWGVQDQTAWPHSHVQAMELRAFSDAGVIDAWQPDPKGGDAAVTRVSLEDLRTVLAADMTAEDSDFALALADVDYTRALLQETDEEIKVSERSDLRAYDIESAVIIPLEEIATVDKASLELDPYSDAEPVLTVEITPLEDKSLTDVVAFVDQLIPPEKIKVLIFETGKGQANELLLAP
ncbi:MAG: hypothetical protein GY926_23390 [bacterium]|nr:hypothetical protein [bacterium]